MTVRPVRLVPSTHRRALRGGLVAAAILAMVACLTSPPALAQGTVTGVVVDAESGQPVTETLAELITNARERVGFANADAQGRFEITGAPAGTYSLVLSRLGYEIRRVDGVTVGAGPTDVGTVQLVSRALRMNPLVVTPSRTEEKALKAPASTWVVSTKDIESRPATTSADHVRSLPGVDVTSNGLTQHSVVARGFNNVFSGSLFVLTDNRWASVPSLRVNTYSLIPTTDEDIDHIEFVLGPGSALYGPNVSNGVMHILTRSPLTHQGTTITALGGEREVGQLSGRHASRLGERAGFKITANYFRGRDWVYRDPVEDAARAAAIGAGALPDTLLIGARDFDAERFNGEARVDTKLGERTDLILSGGMSQIRSGIEMTGVGAVQARDWRYSYVQARYRFDRLFVQSYLNFSDAGDTYLLRDGARLKDNSLLYAAQAQHLTRLGERQRFIYGVDFTHTVPRTGGTITGRNEGDDQITEFGGYVQSETQLNERLDFVAATRLDDHSRVSGTEVSPRAGFVFRPKEGHSLRVTYNRAFNQPTSNNLFLDLVSSRNIGGGLPFDVRVTGVPKDGFQFARDVGGRPLMRSPFTNDLGIGPESMQLPLNAAVFWPIVQAIVPRMQSVTAPNGTEVGSVMRALNPTTGGFDLVSDVADVAPIKPQLNNTAEIGYKGFIANRLSLGVDLYYSRVEDFVSPLLVPTPSVFLNPAMLAGWLATHGVPPESLAFYTTAVARIPLATVTPINTVGDPYDIFLTYRNFGNVDLWGADLGATFLVNDQLSVTGTYSIVDRNLFRNQDGIADIALNAPMNKATLAANYRNPRRGLAAELRGRYVDRFPMNSGVFVGVVDSYAVFDANVTYSLPFSRGTDVSLAGTNLFDERHQEFVGAPEIGRLVFLRVRQTF
ncbi:MAG: TonB-dependent receptor [Candidatus Eiseniibacteriota bacterium]